MSMPRSSYQAFTIVELLIVIVVISILAAITVTAYNGIQSRAHDSTIKSDLRSFYQSVQISNTKEGVYPKWSSELTALSFKASRGSYNTDNFNLVYCPPYPYDSSTSFAVLGRSKSGTIFYHGTDGNGIYNGSYTMNDYVDICLDLTDKNNVFAGNYAADPQLYVTSAGYSRSANPQWNAWVAN
ncbi:prepilin-type N-terminal cleavage/methylation domain-containing protein [Candidatus Saccharibacteria bacterium]|nr:prepilin-type N-terminal cleavage/methylation domain-containing protein [Candidatus Saccharibacteria bacterium]